jgi:glycosyltransferase involved in cell wall biosynthesis
VSARPAVEPPRPRVSVIVPVFDGAAFLPDCLESIMGQTLAVHEMIVVDDGSTDGSATVAETFEAVRVLRQDNEGPAVARNAGLEVAVGERIAFCDADDRWLPTKNERQVASLDEHPDVDCVLCRSEIDVTEGTVLPDYLAPDVVYGDPGGVMPMTGLFRRALLDELGGFHDHAQGQDFDLLIRARELGARIDVLDEPLAVRRVHDANWTRQFGTFAPGMFRSVRDHLRRAQ